MIRKTVIVFFLTIFFVTFIFSTSIIVSKVDASFDCLTLNNSSSQADKDFCRKELSQIEAQLANLLNKQKEQQKQTGTLKGDVRYLTSQINTLKTKVKSRVFKIAQLKIDITDKVFKIKSLSEKINREHESLAQLLRNINDFDNKDFIYLIFSDDSLSSFYNDLESYASIKKAIKTSVDQIRGVKTETEVQKKSLQKKQNTETDVKAKLERTKKRVVRSETDKKKLLAISKKKENTYKKLAAEKKIQADRIRSALFNLAGISQKIEFGTALKYANEVKSKTGIDPAFLLAILTQESNLGANVGQCYLTNPDTGAGVGKNTGRIFKNVMKPTRDVAPFLKITNALGFNAFKTAVSCPIAGVVGYGGAMGPAQFIPSTWKLFEKRLKNTLGHEASPWNPQDAFMASAMYLTDLGAKGNSRSRQNKAACKYYGSRWSSCSYSRSVMRLKSKIQDNIDLLSS